MRKLFAIVDREARERWQLPLGAALLGLLAWLAAWLPQLRRIPSAEVRSGAALVMSAALLLGATVALGASMMSRGLKEGRLAFYYVRPVGAATLWCGKVAAALLLVAASGLLLWLPTLIAGGAPSLALGLLVDWPETLETLFLPPSWGGRYVVVDDLYPHGDELSPGSPWLWLAVALTVLLLASHAFAVALRSRSPRILLDGVLLAVVAALGWSAVSRLVVHGALGTFYRSVAVIAGVVVAALLAAGLAQTAEGRTSPARSHAVLSAVLWSVLLVAFLGWEIVSRQVLRADLEDLAAVTHFQAPPAGDWLVVGGPARGGSGYAPVFAVHPPSGERRKLGVLQGLCGAPMFSADGDTLVWAASPRGASEGAGGCEIRYLDLSSPGEPAREPAVFTPYRPASPYLGPFVELDAEGRRLAIVGPERLALYALPSGATLAAVRLPPESTFATPRFAGGEVRIHRQHWKERGIRVWRLDPATRGLEELGRLPGSTGVYRPDGERLAVWGQSSLGVYRAADLRELSRVQVDDGWRVVDLRWLDDGGFVVVERSRSSPAAGVPASSSVRARRFDAEAAEVWALDLAAKGVLLGAEPDPGRLWMGVSETRGAWASRLVDLGTGGTVQEVPGFIPSWHPARAGSAAARILIDGRGTPFAYDGESAAPEPLLELSKD